VYESPEATEEDQELDGEDRQQEDAVRGPGHEAPDGLARRAGTGE
jgi:hypothetical protein